MIRTLLWVTPKWPFPATDGARIATVNLLRSLAAEGEVIDMLAIAGPDEECDTNEAIVELGLRGATVVKRCGPPTSLLKKLGSIAISMLLSPKTPLTMRFYQEASVVKSMEKLIRRATSPMEELRIIVYDGLHPAAHSTSNGLFRRPLAEMPVVYRAHNCEADIWIRKAENTSSRFTQFLVTHQARLVERFEGSLIEVAAIAAVSSEDLSSFKRRNKTIHGGVVPIGYHFEPPPPYPTEGAIQVMFLGRLDWHPNREGLKWFLDNVWPKVISCRSDISLAIAGSGNGDWIKPYLRPENNINFYGKIDSIDELYEKSALCLVPIFYGSGTRVKAIEACRFARPCISTALGVEGMPLFPGEHYIQAETAGDWIDGLINFNCSKGREIGKAAWQMAMSHFDSVSSAREFKGILDSFCKFEKHCC